MQNSSQSALRVSPNSVTILALCCAFHPNTISLSQLCCYGRPLQLPDEILMRNNGVLMAGYATPSRLQCCCCASAKNDIMPPHSAHLRCWWSASKGFKSTRALISVNFLKLFTKAWNDLHTLHTSCCITNGSLTVLYVLHKGEISL